jgi:hypothetical protein
MSLKNVGFSGPNFVPAYQISGVPYVTSSAGDPVSTTVPKKITFPFVTRFFTVTNLSIDPLRVGFSENGVKGVETNNYFIVHASSSYGLQELRCKELYLMSDGPGTVEWSLVAGLTSVPWSEFPILTGTLNDVASFKGIG